jgi:hypothetical protein
LTEGITAGFLGLFSISPFRETMIIHVIAFTVVDHCGSAGVDALPGSVIFEDNLRCSRMVQLKVSSLHFLNQVTIDKELQTRAEVQDRFTADRPYT